MPLGLFLTLDKYITSFECFLLAWANIPGGFLDVVVGTFNEVILFSASNMFGVTNLVVRKVLRQWSWHTSSRLLSIWRAIVKFVSMRVVTCFDACDGMRLFILKFMH